MESNKEQLPEINDLRIRTLNFDLDNALDSFLLFYTGYYNEETKKESNTGYCDVVASTIGDYFNNENSAAIMAYVQGFFDLYKKQVREIVKQEADSIRKIIENKDEASEEDLKEASEGIFFKVAVYYGEQTEDLCNEIAKYDKDHDIEEIKDYFSLEVSKKLMKALEDKISFTMGVTKNSFVDSSVRLEKITKTNEEILATAQKAA